VAGVGADVRDIHPEFSIARGGTFLDEWALASTFVFFFCFLRKPNLLKNMGLMPPLRHSTRWLARMRAATH
jgi:hypothetical protein